MPVCVRAGPAPSSSTIVERGVPFQLGKSLAGVMQRSSNMHAA